MFDKYLELNIVEVMSERLLGTPYSQIQKIIYPLPRYTKFQLKKRNGNFRQIFKPNPHLQELQEKILLFLNRIAPEFKPCVHGFVKEKSIVTNANKHCSERTKFLLNIDLQDYFPSINFYRVRGIFMSPPFNCSYQVSTVLAQICTFNNQLPQGAPTSPFLANLASRRLDSELTKLAKMNRATYSRYADDLTFSFSVASENLLPSSICTYSGGVLSLGGELELIVENNSFKINRDKSRISTKRGRLEVTGITINKFPNVKREFIDQIRGGLHAWEKYGVEKTELIWREKVLSSSSDELKNRIWSRQRRCKTIPKFYKVLWGKVLYLRMVRGAKDAIYMRFAEKFNHLIQRDQIEGVRFLPTDTVVRRRQDLARAVFVVEWEGTCANAFYGGQGTAFAYLSREKLVTCEHVFRCETDDGNQLSFDDPQMVDKKVTVWDSFSNKNVPVRVIAKNIELDLAILEFEDKPPRDLRYFERAKLPPPSGEAGILIGFPNWNPGRPANIAEVTVESRFNRKALPRVEIGTIIRKGNSGGPLLDSSFRVAGVAQEGATQSGGNNECLCYTELDKWLTTVG